MDEKSTLYEALAIVEPTAETSINHQEEGLTGSKLLLFIFICSNLFLVVFFSTINVICVLNDQLGHRLKVMIEPFGILILGVVDRLNTYFGSHASNIVGLCSIVILIGLIWAGRVTGRGVLKAVCRFISLVAIFYFAGVACEFYLVLYLGPSKLRNKMLSTLGYEVGGLYLCLVIILAIPFDDYYKNEQADGRPVPWFLPTIISGIAIVTTFIITIPNCPWGIINFEMSMMLVMIIVDTFVDESYQKEHASVVLAIASGIPALHTISIVASARQSYTDFETVLKRDFFINGVCTTFLVCALLTSQLIGKVVVQTTKCSAVYTSTVNKSSVLCAFITILCICKCFKVTPTNLSDFVVRSYTMIGARLHCNPPPPPAAAAETELDTLLTDTDCESKSSNQDDEQLNDITAHKKSWGQAGCTATVTAITGTTRDNASYTILSDTESGEMSIRTSERRRECI